VKPQMHIPNLLAYIFVYTRSGLLLESYELFIEYV
jgi:hypothetical protein